jgi:hypothetical protein
MGKAAHEKEKMFQSQVHYEKLAASSREEIFCHRFDIHRSFPLPPLLRFADLFLCISFESH